MRSIRVSCGKIFGRSNENISSLAFINKSNKGIFKSRRTEPLQKNNPMMERDVNRTEIEDAGPRISNIRKSLRTQTEDFQENIPMRELTRDVLLLNEDDSNVKPFQNVPRVLVTDYDKDMKDVDQKEVPEYGYPHMIIFR